jgi:hypothetical protein
MLRGNQQGRDHHHGEHVDVMVFLDPPDTMTKDLMVFSFFLTAHVTNVGDVMIKLFARIIFSFGFVG